MSEWFGRWFYGACLTAVLTEEPMGWAHTAVLVVGVGVWSGSEGEPGGGYTLDPLLTLPSSETSWA